MGTQEIIKRKCGQSPKIGVMISEWKREQGFIYPQPPTPPPQFFFRDTPLSFEKVGEKMKIFTL